jgi:multicomponent Na+:H+ antiporter subunit D
LNILTCTALLVVAGVLFARVPAAGAGAASGSWPAPFGITLVADLLSAAMVLVSP